MQVEATSSVLSKYSAEAQSTTATATNEMNADSFMKLLMAQLTNQNPLEPLDDTQMMTQFTQLNSLQELQQIGASLTQVVGDSQASYAASLLGKLATVYTDDGYMDQGYISGFSLYGGEVYVEINDNTFSLADIISVGEGTTNG